MCCCDLGSRRKGKTGCVMGKGDGRVNAQMLKWVLQWKASEHILLEIQQWQISASSGMMRFCWVSKNKQFRRMRREGHRVCNGILSHFCVFPIFMCQNYLDCKSDVPEVRRERRERCELRGTNQLGWFSADTNLLPWTVIKTPGEFQVQAKAQLHAISNYCH